MIDEKELLKKVIEHFEEAAKADIYGTDKRYLEALRWTLETILNSSTVETKDVTHCKDCKHGGPIGDLVVCKYWFGPALHRDDYCSKAVKICDI